jgi:hypothetical protein
LKTDDCREKATGRNFPSSGLFCFYRTNAREGAAIAILLIKRMMPTNWKWMKTPFQDY